MKIPASTFKAPLGSKVVVGLPEICGCKWKMWMAEKRCESDVKATEGFAGFMDEVVKVSPHARAIRDVEDEELRSFFYGMSPWQFIMLIRLSNLLQFILIVAASSVGEELFYRAAVQGALADVFVRGNDLVANAHGMAALTGILPPFVPFAQAFAAVITAALTGSLYYVAASPKDPTYVVAPVLSSRSGRQEMKKLFAGMGSQVNEMTNNILAPIITHGIYSATILGHGLWKIHDHRRRLRQRVQQLNLEEKNPRNY
ncbi:hypothetical protein Tco_0691102 [Tanacetum coccineum]